MKEEVAPAEEEDGEPGPEGMGVPEFWLRAMKNHEVIEEQITLKVHHIQYTHIHTSRPRASLSHRLRHPALLARLLPAGANAKNVLRAES